jgi:ribosome-binding factor A
LKEVDSVSSRRLLKAGEAIRSVVSTAILTELRDPRVQNVTVIAVEVMPDMREAKVYVSIMGSEVQQKTALRGLQNSAGFLQQRIAERIDTRYTPRLTFVLDDGVKKSMTVTEILEQIAREREAGSAAPPTDIDNIDSDADDDSTIEASDDDASDADADDASDADADEETTEHASSDQRD